MAKTYRSCPSKRDTFGGTPGIFESSKENQRLIQAALSTTKFVAMEQIGLYLVRTSPVESLGMGNKA